MNLVEGRVTLGESSKAGDTPESEPTIGTFESVAGFLEALDEIARTHDATIQAFDARYVAGETHLREAVEHAMRSIERDEAVADEPAVEILLYAAGRRQIDRAMEMGVGPGETDVVVVVIGGDEDAVAQAVRDQVRPADVEPDPEILTAFFGISDAERRASDADLETLVCERVALLDVEK